MKKYELNKIEKNKIQLRNKVVEIKILWNNKVRNLKGICIDIKGKGSDTYLVFSKYIHKIEVKYKIFIYNPRVIEISFLK